jgi:hypothetical protein
VVNDVTPHPPGITRECSTGRGGSAPPIHRMKLERERLRIFQPSTVFQKQLFFDRIGIAVDR